MMPIGIPDIVEARKTAAPVSFVTRRRLFVDAGGDNNDPATDWQFQSISWDEHRQEALVGATPNRVGFMTDLRRKVTPFTSPDAAFGFTAGAGTLGFFRSALNGDLWWLGGPIGANGEIGRSTDNGVTWTLVNTGTALGFVVTRMAQAPNGRLWVRGTGSSLHFSDDFGASFTAAPSASASGSEEAIRISPDGGTVFFLGGGSVFSSGPNVGNPPVFTQTDLSAQNIQLNAIHWNRDASLAFLSSSFGAFGFTRDFQTYTPIPDRVNPIIRGNAAGATTGTLVLYFGLYRGFIAFSTDSKADTLAFFPEDDPLNAITIPWSGTGSRGGGTIDENGYAIWVDNANPNFALAGLLPALSPL